MFRVTRFVKGMLIGSLDSWWESLSLLVSHASPTLYRRIGNHRNECPHRIIILRILVHNLYSHVTLLGWAVSTRRARKVECSTERQLAA